MPHRLRALVLCAVALVLSTVVARADVGPKWSDDQLASFSDAIVTGRVADIAVGRDLTTGAIYTYVTIAVDDVLKGDIPEREIVVKQLGGRIGDVGLAVGDQATFARGEEVLLYLETRPRDGTLYTSALGQGKWNIERDAITGERIATRPSPLAQERGVLAGEGERRVLSRLVDRLRGLSQSAGLPSAARAFRVLPSPGELSAAVHVTTTLPFTAMGFRWNEFDTSATIPMDVQASGQPGLSGGGTTELNRAIGQWTGVTPLSVTAAGTGTFCEDRDSGGRIAVSYDDTCNEISDSGGVLAEGGAWFTQSGGRTVGGVAYGRAVSGFLITNNSSTARTFLANSGCFQFVETHEFGHTLGMGHSTDTGAVMYPSVSFSSCSSGAQSLNADDRAGILAIYPNATTSTAPGAPSGVTATASGTAVTIRWTAPTTGGAPTGYLLEAGSASGLANLANFNTGSTATSFSATAPSGTYFIRVKATNSAGTSAASNEAVLTVGGACSGAPGAPSGLAITGNSGGTVALSWTAASGSPTSYIIEAGSAPGASNLANIDLGSNATSMTASAPRGTYYVRVRAKNACGTGAASNEVTLIVP